MALAIGLLLSGATTQVARFQTEAPSVAGINPFAAAPAADAGSIAPVHPASLSLDAPDSFRRRATLTATVAPPSPGNYVAFHVRSGTTWRVAGSARMDGSGRASIAWQPAAAGMYSIRAVTGSGPATTIGGVANIAALTPGARIVRWREWIEPGLEGRGEFVGAVKEIFIDARGWAGTGDVFFIYTPNGRVDLLAKLATPKTTDRLCRPTLTRGIWSCHAGDAIVINSDRWFKGSPTLRQSVAEYRALAVNHETGHALGFGHAGCGAPGSKAPVMMQQSKGLSGCVANAWPLPRELARL